MGSSVDFPSPWPTGLGRSGIGPEAGGGGRWAGGSYGGAACRRCDRSHVRDAGESFLALPGAPRSGAPGEIARLQLEGDSTSRVDIPGKPGGARCCLRTTSHPRSTETGDCQSRGGVAAISSKNIFRLVKDKARIWLVVLKADVVLTNIQFTMYDVQRWKNVPSELIFPTRCRLLVASRNGRPVPPRGTPVQPRPAKMVKTTRQWKGKIKVTLESFQHQKP